MFCTNCGNKLEETDIFCSECGKKIIRNDGQNEQVKKEIIEKQIQFIENCDSEINEQKSIDEGRIELKKKQNEKIDKDNNEIKDNQIENKQNVTDDESKKEEYKNEELKEYSENVDTVYSKGYVQAIEDNTEHGRKKLVLDKNSDKDLEKGSGKGLYKQDTSIGQQNVMPRPNKTQNIRQKVNNTRNQGSYSNYPKKKALSKIVPVAAGAAIIAVIAGISLYKLNGDKYGFMNSDGTMLTELKYTECREFKNGMAVVSSHSKSGAVNEKGLEVISPQYSSLSDFNSNGYSVACKDGEFGIIDKMGNIIVAFNFNSINQVEDSDKYYIVSQYDKSSSKDVYGIIDESGTIIVPLQDGKIEYYGENGYYIREGSLFNDKNGKISDNRKVEKYCADAGLAVFEENGQYGVLNNNGDVLVSPSYDELDIISADMIEYAKGSKYGFMGTDENMDMGIEIDKDAEFHDNLCRVKYNGKYGYISKTGKYIRFNSLNGAGDFYDGYAAVVTDENQRQLINTCGGVESYISIPKGVVYFDYITDKYIAVNESSEDGTDNTCGYSDFKGNMVVPYGDGKLDKRFVSFLKKDVYVNEKNSFERLYSIKDSKVVIDAADYMDISKYSSSEINYIDNDKIIECTLYNKDKSKEKNLYFTPEFKFIGTDYDKIQNGGEDKLIVKKEGWF